MFIAGLVSGCIAAVFLLQFIRMRSTTFSFKSIQPVLPLLRSHPHADADLKGSTASPSNSRPIQEQPVPDSSALSTITGNSSSQDLSRVIAPKVPIRIIVAMTGATGAALGVKLLQTLRRMDIETHLIISKWAASTLTYETDYTVKEVKALATKSYSSSDVSAPISSGSFRTRGMIIVPCSMKTLSAVATGFGEDLITRAADVILKERRKLVVVARETPLNGIHLQNMTTIHNNGGIIFPPVPAFYTRPQSVDDIVTQSVGRMLDMFDLDAGDFERWSGL